MVPDQIEHEIDIAAPPERVWEVVTEAQHLGTWFGDAGAEIDLRPGGRFTCRWREHGTARAVVEVVEPPTRFSFRWSGPLGDEPTAGNATTVEFTLEPTPHGTRLRVVERGFASLATTADEQAGYAEGNVTGWRAELAELRGYVADLVA